MSTNTNKKSGNGYVQPKIAVIDFGGRERLPHGTDFVVDDIKRHFANLVFYECDYVERLQIFRENTLPVIECTAMFVISNFTFVSMGKKAKESIRAMAKSAKMQGIPIYFIVLGTTNDFYRVLPSLDMDDNSEVTFLNVLSCFCKFQSVGSRRLVELMKRILGLDLPEPHFPNYDWDMLRLMTIHINLENFNEDSPRENAIPKYMFDHAGMPIITNEMLEVFEKDVSEPAFELLYIGHGAYAGVVIENLLREFGFKNIRNVRVCCNRGVRPFGHTCDATTEYVICSNDAAIAFQHG